MINKKIKFRKFLTFNVELEEQKRYIIARCRGKKLKIYKCQGEGFYLEVGTKPDSTNSVYSSIKSLLKDNYGKFV